MTTGAAPPRRHPGPLRHRQRPRHPAHLGRTAAAADRPDRRPRPAARAVLGYPDNGPYAVGARPLRRNPRRDQRGLLRPRPDQALDRLAARQVRSGNSGGPLVDAQGRVLGTVFATTTSGNPGRFAIPDDVVQAALGEVGSEVDTGPCTG